MKDKEIGVPLTRRRLHGLRIHGGMCFFMKEPQMIYCSRKCAFSDIAELKGIWPGIYSKWIVYQKLT